MSPLARIRQVAACATLVFFAAPGLAADAPAQTSRAVQPAQAQPATGAVQPPQEAQTAQAPQPALPVKLAPNAPAQLARSALLSVEATAAADSLRLSIRRMGDKSLVSSDDVTVTVDGRNESVTRESGGVYEVPINDLRGDGVRDVEMIVAHDG